MGCEDKGEEDFHPRARPFDKRRSTKIQYIQDCRQSRACSTLNSIFRLRATRPPHLAVSQFNLDDNVCVQFATCVERCELSALRVCVCIRAEQAESLPRPKLAPFGPVEEKFSESCASPTRCVQRVLVEKKHLVPCLQRQHEVANDNPHLEASALSPFQNRSKKYCTLEKC